MVVFGNIQGNLDMKTRNSLEESWDNRGTFQSAHLTTVLGEAQWMMLCGQGGPNYSNSKKDLLKSDLSLQTF